MIMIMIIYAHKGGLITSLSSSAAFGFCHSLSPRRGLVESVCVVRSSRLRAPLGAHRQCMLVCVCVCECATVVSVNTVTVQHHCGREVGRQRSVRGSMRTPWAGPTAPRRTPSMKAVGLQQLLALGGRLPAKVDNGGEEKEGGRARAVETLKEGCAHGDRSRARQPRQQPVGSSSVAAPWRSSCCSTVAEQLLLGGRRHCAAARPARRAASRAVSRARCGPPTHVLVFVLVFVLVRV